MLIPGLFCDLCGGKANYDDYRAVAAARMKQILFIVYICSECMTEYYHKWEIKDVE